MKNKFLFTTICLLGISTHVNAQHDTLQMYPFFYCYNWDGVGLPHGDTMSHVIYAVFFLGQNNESMDIFSQIDNITKYALYQHCDSSLHAIGIACGDVGASCNGRYDVGLYDSTMELLRSATPSVNWYWDYGGPRVDSSYYFFSLPGNTTNHAAYGYDLLMQFTFFDEPVDISGDFYISYEKAPDNECPPRLPTIHGVYERNGPPWYINRAPFKAFLNDSKTWVDDTAEHSLPLLFLLIAPGCNKPEARVTTDYTGCITVEWDTLRYQEQWVLRLEGPDGIRYDTVGTNRFTYCDLDTNASYAVSVQTQCYRPGGHSWSDWSDPVTIGHGTAAIEEVPGSKFHVSIHPNPASRQVEVSSTLPMTRIETTDILGRSLYDMPATGYTATLDVSSWSHGTYLLRIHTTSGISTRKLLVK